LIDTNGTDFIERDEIHFVMSNRLEKKNLTGQSDRFKKKK